MDLVLKLNEQTVGRDKMIRYNMFCNEISLILSIVMLITFIEFYSMEAELVGIILKKIPIKDTPSMFSEVWNIHSAHFENVCYHCVFALL